MTTKKTDIVNPTGDFIRFIKEAKQESKKSKLTKKDRDFVMLTEMDGWKHFKDMVDKELEGLRSLIDYDASGQDIAQVGLRFLVADLAAYKIESIIRKVDIARELYEQEQARKDKKGD